VRPNETLSADGKLAATSWGLAFGLATIAVYSPVIVIGLLGFTRDADCRAQWWLYSLMLPGLTLWTLLLQAHDAQIAGWPLRRFQPPWISLFWGSISNSLQAVPKWVHLGIGATLTLTLVLALAVLFRQFPQRGRAREVIFAGGLICALLLSAAAYAMFRA
jgi:hypothetical protein